MLIQIDFYKSGGKWYAGGRVEIEPMPWQDGIVEAVIENQDILVKDWWKHNEYYLVLSDLPESMSDPNYRVTYKRLYTPQDILYSKKKVTE